MKLYTRKKSQAGKVVIFLLLAVIFCTSAFFLGRETLAKVNELSAVKEQLILAEEEKNTLEASSNEIKGKEEALKKQVDELEDKLTTLKRNNPDINLNDNIKRYAYLTFDDGPSKNTSKILDFLKVNNIKATFFVVGAPNEAAVYKRIFDEGHTLAVHSYTHQYSKIYKSPDAFMADIHELIELLEGITGEKPNILRFPGGSNNSIGRRFGGQGIMGKVIDRVKEEGFIYFDWNVDSMDAAKNSQEPQAIVDAVLEGVKGKDHAVILLHDAAVKTTTVEALPKIAEELKKQGFIFKELTAEVEPIQFR